MARFVSSPETFFVEEISAYSPCGEGDHTYLWIEKRDLTTLDAVAKVAAVLGVQARDVGYAGMKDRRATTRQWLSVPGVARERAREIVAQGIRVLDVSQHRNKLRVGHLHGNRFEVVLTELAPDDSKRIAVALDELVVKEPHNWAGYWKSGRRSMPYTLCTFPWNALLVLWNGDVSPCSQDFFGTYILGNAMEKPLTEIWNDEPMRRLRAGLSERRFEEFSSCSDCDRLWRDTFLGIPREYLRRLIFRRLP